MKPRFSCELEYFPSQHLSQLYDGFQKLKESGLVDLSIKRVFGNPNKPLLTAIINNKYKVIYDTLDGLNWIEGSIKENLEYFKNTVQADFYFKRSYTTEVFESAPTNCRVYPLGLNCTYAPAGTLPKTFREKIQDAFAPTPISSKDLEYDPILAPGNKILFLTRLWNPDEVSSAYLKQERERINQARIRYIKACRKEFGSQFTGGLQEDAFSRRYAPESVMPASVTNRKHFLATIKEHTICIATNGLHDSIGWKVGEYVSASRAILSEPLQYGLPGDFEEDKNYFSFNSEAELVGKIRILLADKKLISDMMHNNFNYYMKYVKSDVLVLNTLLKIEKNTL